MNYGDKLRQMTNDMQAIEIYDNILPLLEGDCGFHIETIHHYLNTEAETTGHEDLINAGWELTDTPAGYITYKLIAEERIELIFKITKDWGNKYETDWSLLTDDMIDFLRKCADKIRKEKGWDK